jgi:D-3-phosphoglycerate dehydrogenase
MQKTLSKRNAVFRIQTLNKIAPKGLDLFSREHYEVASEIANPDAIVLRSFNMHDMALPETVRAVARAGAGMNNIPIERCSEKGIVVFNTPGANANGVKELVLAGLLLASRDIIDGHNWVQSIAEEGKNVPALIEKTKSRFSGQEISGKKLGIIGLGAIGSLVANDALALGMEVIGYDPFLSVDAAWGLSSSVQRASGLETMLSDIDYLSIHIPLMESTKGMFNNEKFAMMKEGIRVLNFARGGLVNTDDLKAAIAAGKIAAYVTDFPDAQLLGVKGVIPIPHLGASTEESENNCAAMACRQLKDFLETGNIKNSVNFPSCELPVMAGGNRIIIANKNILNMISEISTVLAKNSINIVNMINKSKDDLAYNIIDVDEKPSETILAKLRKIDGVITVKVIQ